VFRAPLITMDVNVQGAQPVTVEMPNGARARAGGAMCDD
jgi:hypothetical protein